MSHPEYPSIAHERSVTRAKLITVHDAAALLSLSPSTVRRMLKRGHLGHVRIGRAVRIRLSDVERTADLGLDLAGLACRGQVFDPTGGPGRTEGAVSERPDAG